MNPFSKRAELDAIIGSADAWAGTKRQSQCRTCAAKTPELNGFRRVLAVVIRSHREAADLLRYG
jgi:hypothetical protein